MAIGEKIKAPEESHRANSGRSTKQEKPADTKLKKKMTPEERQAAFEKGEY
jgi:hypothetical protein